MPRNLTLLCALALVACGGDHPTQQAAADLTLAAACSGDQVTPATAAILYTNGESAPSGCAATASTCEELTACEAEVGMDCTADACDGDTLVRCVDGREVREGCALTCVDSTAGAVCADAEVACESSRCLNERTLLLCAGGTHVVERDCGALLGDAICAAQDGVSDCLPTTNECMDGRVECDGDDGRVCHRGVWIDFRCTDVGYICQVPEAGVLRCIEP